MRTRPLVLLLGILLVSLCCGANRAYWGSFTVESGDREHRIAFHRPARPAKAVPVVVFLHGAGERGADVDGPIAHAGPWVDRFPEPALLVVPQVKRRGWWSDAEYMALVPAILDRLAAGVPGSESLSVDPQRIYLVGISMGGHGVLQIGARNPERYAALISLCPRLARPDYLAPAAQIDGDPTRLARALARTPLWLFHGDQDEVVPVENARRLDAALRAVGSQHHYTEFAGAPHAILDRSLGSDEVFEWLFAQRRAPDDR